MAEWQADKTDLYTIDVAYSRSPLSNISSTKSTTLSTEARTGPTCSISYQPSHLLQGFHKGHLFLGAQFTSQNWFKQYRQVITIMTTEFTDAFSCMYYWVSDESSETIRVLHYSDIIMGAMVSQITSLTHHCLLNRLFRCRSKKTSKLRVTDLCAGNSPVTGEFPARMVSNAENGSIWWRHHVYRCPDLLPPHHPSPHYGNLWPA